MIKNTFLAAVLAGLIGGIAEHIWRCTSPRCNRGAIGTCGSGTIRGVVSASRVELRTRTAACAPSSRCL